MGIIVLPQLVAGAYIGTTAYALTVGNSKMHVVSFATPSALALLADYDLNAAAFAVDQKDPSAIVSYAAGNRVYVQNASEGLPADMVLAAYNVANPLAVTQLGSPAPLNFGTNLFIGANGCNALLINYPIIYSLLGGDISTTAAQLNAIDATNLNVIDGPVAVGTFSDKPRSMYLDTVNQRLYVFSGTTATANQKVFVYDVSAPLSKPVLVTTLAIGNAAALPGLRHGFVSNGVIAMIAGLGTVGNVNLVLYDTAGAFLGQATVTSGLAGTAIAEAA